MNQNYILCLAILVCFNQVFPPTVAVSLEGLKKGATAALAVPLVPIGVGAVVGASVGAVTGAKSGAINGLSVSKSIIGAKVAAVKQLTSSGSLYAIKSLGAIIAHKTQAVSDGAVYAGGAALAAGQKTADFFERVRSLSDGINAFVPVAIELSVIRQGQMTN